MRFNEHRIFIKSDFMTKEFDSKTYFDWLCNEFLKLRETQIRQLLTTKEQVCVKLIKEGKTISDIAKQLKLSSTTIEYYLRKAYLKITTGSSDKRTA